MDFLKSLAGKKADGLVALGTESGMVRYVHGAVDNATASVGKPVVLSLGSAECDGAAASIARAYKAFGFGKRTPCATLLRSGEYQISAVEAPEVPAAELKTAMRWRMKDVIDYPVEESVFDLLEIPAGAGAAARTRLTYVIAARGELIKAYVQRFEDAKVPLTVIDIPETAQRNVTALYEQNGRGVGLLYFDDTGGLLTVTSGAELYLVRRFDFTMTQIREAQESSRDDLFGRILLELQRTLDNFERQNSHVVIARLMLGPQPEATALGAYLQANFGLDVVDVALQDVLEFRGDVPDAQTQWQYFHLIGCAIRSESNARSESQAA